MVDIKHRMLAMSDTWDSLLKPAQKYPCGWVTRWWSWENSSWGGQMGSRRRFTDTLSRHQISIHSPSYTGDRWQTFAAPLQSYISSLWQRLWWAGLWCRRGRVHSWLSQWRTCRLDGRRWRLRRLRADWVVITVGNARVTVTRCTRFFVVAQAFHRLVQEQVVFLSTATCSHVICHRQ